jgi:hypothetical protein
MVDGEQEYMFFVYVDSEIEEIYFIMEDEMDVFAGEIYDSQRISFTGVAVQATTSEAAVIKYKSNDVLASEEPFATASKEQPKAILKHIIPRSIKIDLNVLAKKIILDTERNRIELQGLANRWALETKLTKDEAFASLSDKLRQILDDEHSG